MTIMADVYPRCDECSKKMKTLQALIKHYEQWHSNKQLPRRAMFLQDEEPIERVTSQTIRSAALKAEYKVWLAGVVERINGMHHQRHKSKYINVI